MRRGRIFIVAPARKKRPRKATNEHSSWPRMKASAAFWSGGCAKSAVCNLGFGRGCLAADDLCRGHRGRPGERDIHQSYFHAAALVGDDVGAVRMFYPSVA